FRLYVSPDGREGSMPINTDAFIYAGLFSKGDKVQYSLETGRGAWLQMVRGKMRVGEDLLLDQGDGVGITHAERLDLTVEADSEVLLFDLRMNVDLLWR
ncbi:MAG: hypothetical protein KDG51_13205, partial [Calditrichaeota bacterium]|nr:hypothetical protein [Calditrichota bacterium]